jgi:hypothetical protein
MPTVSVVRRPRLPALAALAALVVLSGCGSKPPRTEADRITPPRLGLCRTMSPQAVERASDASPVVDCTRTHTAETFAVGTFPQRFATAAYDDPGLGRQMYDVCGAAYLRFLGADESEALRSLLSWAWFRPSKSAWAKGARWYRCDAVGGPAGAASYRPLPRTVKGLMSGRPQEDWTLCARGARVAGSAKVACSAKHDWRAVTTIVLGRAKDPYPGDRLAQIRSQQFCSDSVGAWLNYPATDYDFGVTVFHEAEWKTGNRRSICWARTDR